MRIRAIGFDLDGTLIDSGLGLSNTIDNMCKQLGLPEPGRELVVTWIGNGVEVLLDRTLKWANAPKNEAYRVKALEILGKCYQSELFSGSPLFPNVKETLEKLKQQNYELVLITNKPSQFVPELMQYLEIDQLFTIMLGANDSIKIKPHPTPIFKILGELGLFQKEFAFVGDSRNDVLCAKNAGVTSIALTYGYNYGLPIADESPDVVIDDFITLISTLDQLNSRVQGI